MSALQVVGRTGYVGRSVPTIFSASGGTEPYAFTVLGGGAGGTINSSGLYTAPPTLQVKPTENIDTIQVTDAMGAKATATITVTWPLMLFCDVIRHEMNLAVDQVYLWDQKFTIPKDTRLYVAVSSINPAVYGNVKENDTSGDGINEFQYVTVNDTLDVNILSRTPEALFRRMEVIMALTSTYAQSQQELNSFYIAKISRSFVNLSDIDGAAIPYRYLISINVHYNEIKTQAIDYYDQFQSLVPIVEP